MQTRYLVLAALACLIPAFTIFSAGEPEPRKRSITIEASPNLLAKGTHCRVELEPDVKSRANTDQVTYEGKIDSTTDDGIMLVVTSESHRVVQTAAYAPRVPFKNRLFRNIGIGEMTPKDAKKVWITNERIKLVQPIPEK